uniref:Uncharacterized protein n=1 Tax=Tetranychus urticae TaxID=32264 RepID=T1JSG0_TETUR
MLQRDRKIDESLNPILIVLSILFTSNHQFCHAHHVDANLTSLNPLCDISAKITPTLDQ